MRVAIKRHRTILAACLVCLWTLCLGIPASADFYDLSEELYPSGDTVQRIAPDKLKKITAADAAAINESMKAYTPPDQTLIQNRAQTYYYYEQLDPIAKQIYDVMLMIARDPVTEENYGVMMTDMDPQTDEFYYEFLCAYFAMTYDHPELFWLYSGAESSMRYMSEALSFNGIYMVYFSLTEPYTKYEEQMTEFNRAAEAFLAEIDTSASDYEIARQIHDKLIDLVVYDDYVLDHMQAEGQNLAHSAYGALVKDSQGISNYAVCDGYSLAYEYLLQQCGIEAVVVGGEGGPNEYETGGHAWNIVKVGGEWYEVDSTWDDAGSLDASLDPLMNGYNYFYEALNDPDYRNKIQHSLFLRSTDVFRNFEPDDSYWYVTHDQQQMLKVVGSSVHIRYSSDGTVDPYNADPTVIGLAPVAEYSYQ